MADPILHIKDAYFFEVPKFMWRYKFESLDDVEHHFSYIPSLVSDHPHATVSDFNRALSGKIIIPQPFATLKNLHDKESGFAISKFMILEVFAGVILVFIFSRLGNWMCASAWSRAEKYGICSRP